MTTSSSDVLPPGRGTDQLAPVESAGDPALVWGAASQRGAARPNNQDAYLALPPVFAVADGMGGHAAGDRASRCVVEALRGLASADVVTRSAIADRLAQARAAIGRIEFDSGGAPGSTLGGAFVALDRHSRTCWMVVNVGDSRTYLWDGHRLTRLTDDHTVGGELAARGIPAAVAAQWAGQRARLTRAVQADIEHEADVWLIPMEVGDRLLVCSDGVHGPLSDEMIGHVLGTASDPSSAAAKLVDLVVAAAGRDDATAVVVDVRSGG